MNPSNFQFSSLERIMIESQRRVMCLPFFFFLSFFLVISRGSFKVSIETHKESPFSAVISQQRKEYCNRGLVETKKMALGSV